MAAACILERYLEDRAEGAIEAKPCVYPPPPQLAWFDYGIIRRHVRSLYDDFDEDDEIESLEQGEAAKGLSKLVETIQDTDFSAEVKRAMEIQAAAAEYDMIMNSEQWNRADNQKNQANPSLPKKTDELNIENTAIIDTSIAKSDHPRDEITSPERDLGDTEIDDELKRMMEIRAARRKRGTLKKKNQ